MTYSDARSGLSIVVPVYNENGVAKDVLDKLISALNSLEAPVELIVVDDGSTDGTSEILGSLSEQITLIRHDCNRGYGAALKTGIRQANYSIIAITDLDGTYPHENFSKLLSGMQSSDMVVGSRTGSKVHIPLIRRPAKWLLNKLANYLTQMEIPDLNSGFRAFRKEIVEKYIHILPNRFSFTTTISLVLISEGYRIQYIPINYNKREGCSKVKPKDALGFLILIIRTITYFNPLRFFMPFSVVLFVLGICRLSYDVFYLYNLTDSTILLFLFALQVSLIGIVADLIVKRNRR
ncbi:hypothetical protein D1BOALGB6SA_6101 [Olavius sp. associated proteobacterium Delta 1]|nr:hypothetical protein D1BOALGB6SA_6101 [Olavius sp. associated proteobacterium Delta 1]